jgi:protein-tyrosine kinase
MNLPIKDRAHLVERAVEALEKRDGLSARPAAPAVEVPLPTTLSIPSLVEAGLVSMPNGQKRSRVVEEITVVQQHVMRGMEDVGSNRIIVVTSARPGEGKTFIALNLAASLAANGMRKVVLIDADGKHGSVSDTLSGSNAVGLCGLIIQERSLPQFIPTEIRNLSFLPYGKPKEKELGLPPGSLVAEALSRLKRSFPDHVLVVDTPPSLSTGDANALSSVAGQVVMVVNAEKTQRNEVEAALDMMEACPSLSLLLNQVRVTSNDSFGAYGDYGARHAD